MRVFADRFLEDASDDTGRFTDMMSTIIRTNFEEEGWETIMADVDDVRYGPIVCSFMDENAEFFSYEEVTDFARLRERCQDKLEDYNLEPKLINMNLVLFKDAVRHVCRIHREYFNQVYQWIFNTPRRSFNAQRKYHVGGSGGLSP